MFVRIQFVIDNPIHIVLHEGLEVLYTFLYFGVILMVEQVLLESAIVLSVDSIDLTIFINDIDVVTLHHLVHDGIGDEGARGLTRLICKDTTSPRAEGLLIAHKVNQRWVDVYLLANLAI